MTVDQMIENVSLFLSSSSFVSSSSALKSSSRRWLAILNSETGPWSICLPKARQTGEWGLPWRENFTLFTPLSWLFLFTVYRFQRIFKVLELVAFKQRVKPSCLHFYCELFQFSMFCIVIVSALESVSLEREPTLYNICFNFYILCIFFFY